jgi:hypothetical protein
MCVLPLEFVVGAGTAGVATIGALGGVVGAAETVGGVGVGEGEGEAEGEGEGIGVMEEVVVAGGGRGGGTGGGGTGAGEVAISWTTGKAETKLPPSTPIPFEFIMSPTSIAATVPISIVLIVTLGSLSELVSEFAVTICCCC